MPELEKSHFDNTHFEGKMTLSTAKKIAEAVVIVPPLLVACAGAAAAGAAYQGVTAAAKLVKEKVGIENSSDSDSISSSTENMPGDSQNSSSQSADRSCLDSDDDLFHNYSERVQIDVQIPSHSYSNDNSSYQFHIHINGKLGTS